MFIKIRSPLPHRADLSPKPLQINLDAPRAAGTGYERRGNSLTEGWGKPLYHGRMTRRRHGNRTGRAHAGKPGRVQAAAGTGRTG